MSARSRIWAIIAKNGQISRTDIGHYTKLSKSRVSLITRELLDKKLIRECPVKKGAGRPSVPLEINSDLALFFGITFHCDPVHAVIMDFSGRVRAELTCPRPGTPDVCVDVTVVLLNKLSAHLGLDPSSVLGVGVSLPAHISADGALCLRSTVLDWEMFPFQATLQGRVSNPVMIENDLNCLLTFMAPASGRPSIASYCLVSFGEGLGSAHMIEGRLVRGANGGAGEIAHARVTQPRPDMPLKACRCGNRGCAETVASVPAIVSRSRQDNISETLSGLCDAANNGEEHALEILHDAATVLGAAIATVVQILDPETVVAVLPDALLRSVFSMTLKQAVDQHVMPFFARPGLLSIQTADDRDWAVGAARVASRVLMHSTFADWE